MDDPREDLIAKHKNDILDQKIQQQADLRIKELEKQQKLQQNADKVVFQRIQYQTVRPGSLITFQYSFYKHDFSPLCLVARASGQKISGLNLHYLTFKYIKQLINNYCGKNFNYQLIKGDKYILNAYRSYKRNGQKHIKQVDCQFLNNVLKTARSFQPGEIEAIRQEIQNQLRKKMNPRAEDLSKEQQDLIYNQPHKDYGINTDMDARKNPMFPG